VKFKPLIGYAIQILLLANEHSSWRYLSRISSLVKPDHCNTDSKQAQSRHENSWSETI